MEESFSRIPIDLMEGKLGKKSEAEAKRKLA